MSSHKQKGSSFQMTNESPISATHRPKRARPHFVTELAENGRLEDFNADNGLTFRLHPRVIRPAMALPYKPVRDES
jgi:hypothetical protein